jgi:hypothetical protein
MNFPDVLSPSTVNSQHPHFKENMGLWEELKQLASGRFPQPSLWLQKRVGEEPDLYLNRVKRFTYNPVYIQCLAAIKKGLNKGILKISGSSIQPEHLLVLCSEAAVSLANFGSCWLSYTSDGFPYLLDPGFITDWDSDGDSLLWVKARSIKRSAVSPFLDTVSIDTFHFWANGHYATYVKGTDGVHHLQSAVPIPAIPFVRIEVPSEQWLGLVAFTKLKQLINIESAVSEAASNLYIQRTVENTKPLPDDDLSETYTNARPDALYTSNAYVYSGKFSFSEATGSSVSVNMALVSAIEAQIYGLFGLGAKRNTNSVESGLSKRYDLKEYGDVLAAYGRPIISGLSRLLSNLEGRDVEVSGLDTFELDSLGSMLELEPLVASASERLTEAYVTAWYDKLGAALSPDIKVASKPYIKLAETSHG